MENNNIIHKHHQPPPPPPFSQPPQQENQQVRNFWYEQMKIISDLKTHQFPLSRIKKIIKSDPDVSMISAEAPILFSKACEMFIVDLTMRSWRYAEENKCYTLQRSDISDAVARHLIYDFLVDIIPRDKPVAADPSFVAMPHPTSVGVPVYYPPGLVLGTPVVDGSGIYAPPHMQAWAGSWLVVASDGRENECGENSGNNGEN